MEFLNMSAKDFRNMLLKEKKNKFGAQKAESNGVVYDSKKECRRAEQLSLLEKNGKIKNLQQQVRFILQDGFVNKNGKSIRPISYIADFFYEDKHGKKYVEDTKGFRTEVYKIKKKMFEYRYRDIEFVET